MAIPSLEILVVEDNVQLRHLLCEMLVILGHRPVGVNSGEEAQEILRRRCRLVDVLLADINLPGMTGIELAQIAHARNPRIRVVFASGFGYLVADKVDFFFTLLQKPYNLAQLQLAIEESQSTARSGSVTDSTRAKEQ